MNCQQAEILICDYAEGALGAAETAALERHMAECAGCAALARDSAAAVAFMEHAADVDVPGELVTRILFDPPWAHARAEGGGFGARLRALWQPVLQPRFAMGMAMTILSFAMLARFVTPVRQLEIRDLNPAAVWAALDDRIYRGWQRTVKFYESLRLVYQIRTTVREWQQQQEEFEAAEPAGPVDDRRLPAGRPPETEPGNR